MTTFRTSREIPAPPDEVFAAFSDPQRLARWWGPTGFTNTFNVCEFKSGGRWSFVMQGPDGRHYRNESVFAEVEPPTKVIVQHVSGPKYRLTITLAPARFYVGDAAQGIFASCPFALGSRATRDIVAR